MGQQEHVSAGVGARKAGARTLVALDELAALAAAFDEPGDLLARIAAHAFEKPQHDGFVGTLQTPIAKSAYRARDEIVALVGCHRKIDRCVPSKKACNWARVCICSSFILITMPCIMTDTRCRFRLKPRWIYAPRSDSNPIGQLCRCQRKIGMSPFLQSRNVPFPYVTIVVR